MLLSNRILWGILVAVLISGIGEDAAFSQTLNITLDAKQPGRTFEGIGAVSAGASSRLLIDYPEPQRSQILDYLFKPNYGASLQHLKVEIGGGVNSTDGTEPTHMLTRGDMNFTRGYEWWLMQQAKLRNPNVMLDCLAWGAPGWIGGGNYYSQDMCDYIASFIDGAKTNYGLTINFTGTHNEASLSKTATAWMKQLRTTLNASGLQNVQLVAADEGGGTWNIVTNTGYGLLYDSVLSNDIARVGAHYPQSTSPAGAQNCGKILWSSEDGIGGSTWRAATNLAKIFNRNYINGRISGTEIWSPITSYYDNLAASDSGLMRANTPWSGNYQIAPAIWITAHTTQFAAPGWKYLEGGASTMLSGGGSLITLLSPNQTDYSVIVETSDASSPQTITFRLTNGLSTTSVNIWQSTQTNQFMNLGSLNPVNGVFTYTFLPGCVYTLSTTTGQAKGNAVPVAAAPFPLPFKDNFESYIPGTTPKYFSDQAGTFEIFSRADGQGQALRQILSQDGIRWTAEWQPYSLIGDASWTDYEVSEDVLIETNGGSAFIMGRVGSVPGFTNPLPDGYWLALNNAAFQWQLYASTNLIAWGAANASVQVWHNLRLAMHGSSLSCYIDQTLVTNIVDFSYASGMAGLGCGGWYGAEFDNFTLRQLHGGNIDLALSATASASSVWQNDPTYSAGMVNDGDPTTRWNTAYPTLPNGWLELDWPTPVTFNRTAYLQYSRRIFGYQIQHWNGSSWITDTNCGTMGAYATDILPTVTASKVRLVLTNMTSAPSLYEFSVYNDAVFQANQTQPVWLNEWMVNNTHTLIDPATGQYEPWFEIYNETVTNVNLAGYYLTTTVTNLHQFQIPSGYSLAPHGFLLVWADGLSSQNMGQDLHADFSLQSPSFLALLTDNGQMIDAVNIKPQGADVSSGSNPDGDPGILNLVSATPGNSNNQIWALPSACFLTNQVMVLNFISFPYTSNRIMTANSLQGSVWMPVATLFSDGLGNFTYANSNAVSKQQFYRAITP